MDEHDVVEAGTDLLFGDPKVSLKKNRFIYFG